MEEKKKQPMWFLYMVECSDKTLYTGISTDVERRVEEHSTTNKCKYTRARQPVELRYTETCGTKSEASKRERVIKKMSRLDKQKMIKKI